jgi:hypothetical protein
MTEIPYIRTVEQMKHVKKIIAHTFIKMFQPARLKKTPWSESARELHRPSDSRLSAMGLPMFADRGCHVVSVTDPYGRILNFLDRSRYFSVK